MESPQSLKYSLFGPLQNKFAAPHSWDSIKQPHMCITRFPEGTVRETGFEIILEEIKAKMCAKLNKN